MKRRVRTSSPGPSHGPSSGPQPRTGSFVSSFETETKTKSRPVGGEIPAAWLARLLAVSCDLPIEEGPDTVASALVEAVGNILPSHAFGLLLRDDDKGQGGRIIRTAREGSQVGISPNPDRIFPELDHERVLELRGEHEGIRLHIASDDLASMRDGTPVHYFMKRVAAVLSSALRTTRLVSAKGRESLELKGQIIQSEKLASLGQIAAGVVHELNNPLTSIVGYSDYLRAKAERDHGDPNDVERLRRISEAAGRILRFSRDLIAYARPSIEPPSPVAIHAVVDQAFVFCEHVLGPASIRIERQFAPDVRPVLGVRDQLTQVFVNLIINACHAMEPQGGTLAVRTELSMQRRAVKVSVSDTGHGIEKGSLKRIFDPFFTTKTDGRGTGLGLSIVRNIVLMHGGAIAVDSALDRGTVFTLELPIAP
jgi:two-component system NtrC family sensor kinase